VIAPFRRRSDPLLVAVDGSSAALVCWVAYRLRFEGDLPLGSTYEHRYLTASAVVALGWCVSTRLSGLCSRKALRLGTPNTDAAVPASFGLGLALVLLNLVLGGKISRAWIGLVVLGLLLVGLLSRSALRHGRRLLAPLGMGMERYALVGTDLQARRLGADLTRATGAPFTLVATLPEDLDPAQLVAAAHRLRLDGLVLPAGGPLAGDLAQALSGTGIDVLMAPGLGGLQQRVASVAMLHGVPLLRVAGLAPRRPALRRPSGPRDLARGVAVLGTRGVPGTYGGFETFAERLALHLVEQGVSTTVYCRTAYATEVSPWRGIRLVTLPTIRSKYLDTVVHTALSALHLVATRGPRDVVLCNAANAPVLLFLRLLRRRVVMNVDGLEWRRGKWGLAGRSWYRMGEWLSVRLASVLVTDADEVRTYYRVRHDTDSVMVPYGADLLPRDAGVLPAGVTAGRFLLYVSRWEPENNPLLVAQAHRDSGLDLAMVMLGQATYDDTLGAQVRAAAVGHCLLPGGVYGQPYRDLQGSALAYVHATEVGGTHPALIEAMGAGNLCLVMDTPENREVAGPADALFFQDGAELAELMRQVALMSEQEVAERRWRARNHAARTYSWSSVGDAYLRLLRGGAPQSRGDESPSMTPG
jgi:glycosyltransferase involved in cell wall biosynthesis